MYTVLIIFDSVSFWIRYFTWVVVRAWSDVRVFLPRGPCFWAEVSESSRSRSWAQSAGRRVEFYAPADTISERVLRVDLLPREDSSVQWAVSGQDAAPPPGASLGSGHSAHALFASAPP